jgi:hypothetical protein
MSNFVPTIVTVRESEALMRATAAELTNDPGDVPESYLDGVSVDYPATRPKKTATITEELGDEGQNTTVTGQ